MKIYRHKETGLFLEYHRIRGMNLVPELSKFCIHKSNPFFKNGSPGYVTVPNYSVDELIVNIDKYDHPSIITAKLVGPHITHEFLPLVEFEVLDVVEILKKEFINV